MPYIRRARITGSVAPRAGARHVSVVPPAEIRTFQAARQDIAVGFRDDGLTRTQGVIRRFDGWCLRFGWRLMLGPCPHPPDERKIRWLK